MKINVPKDLIHNGPGSIKMVPEEEDDLWVAYNLIAEGDSVTVREALKLQIKLEDVEYNKEDCAMPVRGKNILENEHVKIGAYHTLDIKLYTPFVLGKEVWDSLALEVLRQAADRTASADLALILMQEGLANFFLVGNRGITTLPQIKTHIPRKHGPGTTAMALDRFFSDVVYAFQKHIDFKAVHCVVIASPSSTSDDFRRRLLLGAESKRLGPIIENQSWIFLAHTSSGYKICLRQVLFSSIVRNMIEDTKAVKEVQALEDFFHMRSSDRHRACYGPKHVEVANELMAIQTLLINVELIRNSDIATRQKYANLVKAVEDSGGTTHIFSSIHVSGDQLMELSGTAAILWFPLPDLDYI